MHCGKPKFIKEVKIEEFMALYLFHSKNEPVKFYSRDPKHIIETIEYYQERSKKGGTFNNPAIANWVKTIPHLDDIVTVNCGRINYHVGMININPKEVDMEGDFFSEYMQVTPDFLVAVSPEAVLYFDMHRKQLPSAKRGALYKLQIPGSTFGSLNFVPQDVMEAITRYDITPHIAKGMKARERIENIAHPNIMILPIVAQKSLKDAQSN